MTGYDLDDVRAELRPEHVANHYGLKVRPAGRWLRGGPCPECGRSDAFALGWSRKCGRYGWRCHRCRGGDLLDLVARLEGIDTRGDFPRVIEIAAKLAGVSPRDKPMSAEERCQLERDREMRRRVEERQRAEDERRHLAEATEAATATWRHLRHRNRPGEAYLQSRGLADLPLDGEVVRFDKRGSIRLPLYDGEGNIINVPGRYLPGREPGDGRRICNMAGCPTRGTFGHPDDLHHFDGDVVVVEGIFDYLSARVLWPDRACFGAHGACNLPHAADIVAAHIADSSRVLYLVPHHDRAGIDKAREAYRAARAAGLRRDRIRSFDTSAAGDLNDWLCATQTKDQTR